MKMIPRVCALVLALLCCVSAVSAAGTVTYDANARAFIFAPENLFEGFQDVMPGDSRTEQILIKNDSSRKVKIKVYMRSLGAQEETDEFLSQLQLTVKHSGDNVLFDAPANETAQLTDWVYLGTVYSGGEITLDVTLEAPITMTDAYQNHIGYVDWAFKVEERPVSPSDPKPPQTGDPGHVFVYAALAAGSLLGLVILLLLKKRKKQEQ